MAPSESQQSYPKLKLNVSRPKKPVSSTFSSIPRDSPYPFDDPTDTPQTAFQHANDSDATLRSPDDSAISSFPDLDDGQPNYLSVQTRDGSTDRSAVSSVSTTSELEIAFRSRKTSVTFNPQVSLDGGSILSLGQKAPKQEQYDHRQALRHLDDIPDRNSPSPLHRSYSESAKLNYHPDTGEHLDKRKDERPPYREGQMRHPLLQSTVDDLANDPSVNDFDRMASLTSGTTASSIPEEVGTPQDLGPEHTMSPLPISSPMELPQASPYGGAWPLSRRTSSQRSMKSRTDGIRSAAGSVRRPSRRTSTRSYTSSASPASAFLSQWGKEEAAAMVEPDDEGQEIADGTGYIIGRQIGFGGFSVVKEVVSMRDGKKLTQAVKVVRKQIPAKSDSENDKLQIDFEHEIAIWRFLKHPYVLPLLAVYDTNFATFCITPLITTGTLFDLVRKNRKSEQPGLPSRFAKRYLYQLASAIRFLHNDALIVHRDIKLENCLLDLSGPNAATEGGDILVCDFGMSDYIANDARATPEPYDHTHDQNIGPAETSTSIAGSVQYAAPEIINNRSGQPIYSTAVDIWAYGVVMYALLTGALPFQHQFEPRVVMMIIKGDWDADVLRGAPAFLEDQANVYELIVGCMRMDPEERWRIDKVLDCQWLRGCSELYENVDKEWMHVS